MTGFEQWWAGANFMRGDFVMDTKEIACLAWESGQQYALDCLEICFLSLAGVTEWSQLRGEMDERNKLD